MAIEFAIRSRHYPSAEHLCQVFSVKVRTIYEDIRILRERLGLDIQYDRVRNGYYNADPSQRLPTFDLCCEELILLVIACKLICGSLGAPFEPLVKQILVKIGERVTLPETDYLEKLHAFIRIEVPAELAISAVTLYDCAQACIQGEFVEVLLKHDDRTNQGSSIIFRPQQIAEENKRWLLVGYAKNSAELQKIGLEDIEFCRCLHAVESQNRRVLDTGERNDSS